MIEGFNSSCHIANNRMKVTFIDIDLDVGSVEEFGIALDKFDRGQQSADCVGVLFRDLPARAE
jgi:hypothetical protein